VARLAVGISHSPRPARGDHRKCGGPLSRCGRSAHARFAGPDAASGLLARSVAGAGEARAPCRLSLPRRFSSVLLWHCTARSCADAPFESGAGLRNFVTRSARFRAVPGGWFLAGCWELPCRAPMFCSPRCWYYLWPPSAAACMALRVAIGQNRRGHAHHAGRYWSSRSGAGGAARAVWRAGVASSRHGNCLGGRNHHRRSSCGTNSVSPAPPGVSWEPPLAFG